MKFGLLGEKLGHSHSPLIHNEIFKDFNIDATYEKIEIKSDELKHYIDLLRNGTYNGYNVTIPYKKEIMQYLDEIDDHAKKIGAVNTVANIDGKIIGFNTDYYGFYNELIYYNVPCKNENAYVLGTGGASLAVYHALVDLGSNVKYVSRTPKTDNQISYDDLRKENIDILVNTTPVGMYPNINESPLDLETIKKAKYVLDVIFNPKKTKLLEIANSDMNGFFMLVGQAIKAEEIWHNRKYEFKIEDLLDRITNKI